MGAEKGSGSRKSGCFMLKKSGEAPAVQALSGPLLLKSINIALGHESHNECCIKRHFDILTRFQKGYTYKFEIFVSYSPKQLSENTQTCTTYATSVATTDTFINCVVFSGFYGFAHLEKICCYCQGNIYLQCNAN